MGEIWDRACEGEDIGFPSHTDTQYADGIGIMIVSLFIVYLRLISCSGSADDLLTLFLAGRYYDYELCRSTRCLLGFEGNLTNQSWPSWSINLEILVQQLTSFEVFIYLEIHILM